MYRKSIDNITDGKEVTMNPIEEFLDTYMDELTPKEFYRLVFDKGELDQKDAMTPGKYTAIAVCVSQTDKRYDEKKKKMVPKVYRYSMTDDLELIDELQNQKDLFCLMAPLSYAGKKRSAENARMMYGIAVDVDKIRYNKDGVPVGFLNLWNRHIELVGRIPQPTSIVFSGSGIHLYYIFEKPIPMFPNVVKQMQKFKHEFTKLIWNEGIVDIKHENEIQQEGIYQGFRMPGTITKDGSIAKAYLTGDKVKMEDLNKYVDEKFRVTEFAYKSELPLAQAKELYPEWYEERIVNGNKGIINPWHINRNLYDWWKREILNKATVGHRYYCMMILAIYAMKCKFYDEKKNPNPVTREELESDCWQIMEKFEELTDADDNHFDESDVLDALDAYDWGYLSYPRNSVEYKAGFNIPQNKRNGRKQAEHLKRARAVQELDYPDGSWRDGNGRKSKKTAVALWRANHPDGKKADCHRETGLSRVTIDKWWNEVISEIENANEFSRKSIFPAKKTSEETRKRLMAYLKNIEKI